MNIIQIQTKKEYEKLVPPVPKEEYLQLKNSIQNNGLYLPIIINEKGIVLDGHHRFRVCKELGINPKTQTKKFQNKTDEIIFVGESNLHRRQLTPLQRIELVSKLEPYYKDKANQRMILGKKVDPKEKLPEGQVRDILGSKANVSGKQYEKGKKILETRNEDLISEVLSGNKTINKAYHEITKEEKKQKLYAEIKKIQVNLPESIQLHNKPFQDLKIKDNSVSLIFTDPPYEEKSLHLYKELAQQAARVLRDGGSLMCYVGHFCIDRIITMMKNYDLKFQWQMVVIHSGPKATQHGPKVHVGYKPMLWFTKGKYQGPYLQDTIKSEFQGKELHEWAQSTVEADYYIKYLTIENEIVYDPFLGQGTFGVSAAKLGRQFIGSEINTEHFENARKLISNASCLNLGQGVGKIIQTKEILQ